MRRWKNKIYCNTIFCNWKTYEDDKPCTLVVVFLKNRSGNFWKFTEYLSHPVWESFKANNWNSKTMCETCSKLTIDTRTTSMTPFFTPVSLLLTWNWFGTLFWCFNCWLWAGKCRLGWSSSLSVKEFSTQEFSTQNFWYSLQPSEKVVAVTISSKRF